MSAPATEPRTSLHVLTSTESESVPEPVPSSWRAAGTPTAERAEETRAHAAGTCAPTSRGATRNTHLICPNETDMRLAY